MATTEHSINDAIADLLRGTRFAWRGEDVVRSETTGLLAEAGGLRPDIVIHEPYTAPVLIETEVLPAQTVEDDALKRLGKRITDGAQVQSVIAARLPQGLKTVSNQHLKRALQQSHDFDFALFSGESAQAYERYPARGWLRGGIHELSLLAQSASTPPALIDRAATQLEMGVNQAAQYLKAIAETNPAAVQTIAAELHQQDSEQTRRMAMTILVNAFIFHEHLAGGHGELGQVRTLAELASDRLGLQVGDILKDWETILHVNYWPIFDISCRILRAIPGYHNNAFIKQLARTATALVSHGLMRSHDLTGTVFQRLIADRKFLAAFYTKPASAALLVGLAVNEDTLLAKGGWSDPEAVAALRIADFACGTGTLLSTVYQRISQLHELHGGNTQAIHARMMARALVGCDILPAAAHLTAAMLAGAHPQTQYQESAIFTAPYGVQPDGEVKLGSIDLLRHGEMLQGLEITAKAIEATGGADVDIWRYAPHGSFDMVIMNPPFTRPTNHGGQHANVPNPMFAAFGSSTEDQRAMSSETKQLTKGTVANGNAGQASIFLALADRKLKEEGMLALVMPLVFLTGASWEKARLRLADNYKGLILVSIAGSDIKSLSFSADTGLGECLIIGKRSRRKQTRATFVILKHKPSNLIQGVELSKQVNRLISKKKLRRLEDGPTGGSIIKFGNEVAGYAIDAPLPTNGGWRVVRIADLSLAQSAYQLSDNHLVWLPTQSEALEIPISQVSLIGEIGPIGRDINGTNPDGSIRGPFELRELQGDLFPTYPVLWAHNAKRETTMCFKADYEGIPRQSNSDQEQILVSKRVKDVFDTATHCHHNVDFRFNSQATSMQYTTRKTIGGRAWISIRLPSESHEKVLVLWANSTLGLLSYWWHASKQDSGRGSIAKSSLATLPILDITALPEESIKRGGGVFDDLKHLPLKPLHELHIDKNRKLLDRRFYGEVLGLPAALLADGGPLDILRNKLSQEPSIRGSKR